MAYKNTRKGGRSYRRSPRRRNYARRYTGVRRLSRTYRRRSVRNPRERTVKIVIEQAPSSPLQRPDGVGFGEKVEPSKKARF